MPFRFAGLDCFGDSLNCQSNDESFLDLCKSSAEIFLGDLDKETAPCLFCGFLQSNPLGGV